MFVKYKIDCCMGENIWGCLKLLVNCCEYGLGQYGQCCKVKILDFGLQLCVKQKLKGYYGDLIEKQFCCIYVEVECVKGDIGENLIGLLECCLDVIVYCVKFVLIVFVVCQFVNYGYVIVNGKCVNIFLYCVKEGDVIVVCDKFKQLVVVLEVVVLLECDVFDYVEVDYSKMIVIFVCILGLLDVLYLVIMELNLVVEFYVKN